MSTNKSYHVSVPFLRALRKKLTTGNLRSIHLNAIPGKSASRMDLSSLNVIEEDLAQRFMNTLMIEPNMKFTIQMPKYHEQNADDLKRIAKRLNRIIFQNEDNYLEFGTENFGIGYPLLIKKNKQDKRIIKAPLLIWQLDIQRSKKRSDEWIISRKEDYGIILNELLVSHIEADELISLSKLDRAYLEDGLIDQAELIQICDDIFSQIAPEVKVDFKHKIEPCISKELIESRTTGEPWIQWSAVFGIYKAQKESIIHDLDQLIDKFSEFKFNLSEGYGYNKTFVSAVDTDPSQEEIINSINTHTARIIQGPPGTGKSQSITAVITNALENKAKCLVVCEKKTALDVIYNNLDELKLSHLVTIIEDTNRDRTSLVRKIRSRVDEIRGQTGNIRNFSHEYNSKLQNYHELRDELNRKHKAVLATIFGDDHWKEVVGKLLKREDSVEIFANQPIDSAFEMSHEEFSQLTEIINEAKFLFLEVPSTIALDKLRSSLFKDKFTLAKEQKLKGFLKTQRDLVEHTRSLASDGISKYPGVFDSDSFTAKIKRSILSIFSKYLKEASASRKEFNKIVNELKSNHDSDNPFEFTIVDGRHGFEGSNKSIDQYDQVLVSLQADIDHYREYYTWRHFHSNQPAHIRKLIDEIRLINTSDWHGAFERWYYNQVLIANEDKIGPFNQNDRQMQQLKKLRKELQILQQERIDAIWHTEQQKAISQFNLRTGNINSLYNLRSNKEYGRRNSIRKIIHIDPDFFTTFSPVLMVNPVIATSILPLRENMFDLVIFDEASQLRIEDTFTSFIRGKYKIISGDMHQMPPSTYFGKEVLIEDVEDDEEESLELNEASDMSDKESLLQYAIDAAFEKSFLDFHYRSRHPHLIDFSNTAFYGSRLAPMPIKTDYKALQFREINGTYEDNINPKEAEAVIDILLYEIQADEQGKLPSVGVATFNITQRNYIRERVLERIEPDRNLREKYLALVEAGLFVKNLENIQGDERDIIILSTTFGRDKNGNFYQRFGPILQSKGYKLLNVIITRAKLKLIVCTSVPEEFYGRYRDEIEKHGNHGKGLFYAYLAYAKAIEMDDNVLRESILQLLQKHCEEKVEASHKQSHHSSFNEELVRRLKIKYGDVRIKENEFLGGFCVDALILDETGQHPMLAVECDGSPYHRTNEAYLYDVYRLEQFERTLGLPIHFVWSTNWWLDKKKELDKIDSTLNMQGIEIIK